MFASIAGKVTHETLANTLPFYCCWLVDQEDDSKPCAISVVLGSTLFSARMIQFADPTKIWIN